VRVKVYSYLRSPLEVAGMLLGLERASFYNLQRLRLPPLYESGVRYKPEPIGREFWQLPEDTYRIGSGDCEDLAAWRAAELQLSGEDPCARAMLRDWQRGIMHCIVLRSFGIVEDPSKRLGMKGRA
jgi:hypothetical protein